MSNSVVDYIRQQNPEENRSDEELTLLVGDHAPGQYDGYEDFKAQYEALKASRAQAAAPSTYEKVQDFRRQATGEVIRGVAGGIAAIPESIAIGAAGLNRRYPIGPDVPLEEMPTYQAGQAIRRAGEFLAPEPVQRLQDSFWASTVPQALGSSAAFMAGGVATKALKIPGWIGIAGLGSMSGAVQGYQDAISKGASPDVAFDSAFLNSLVGTSEAFPLANILNRADKWSGGTLKKAIIHAGKETFEESLQEALQQTAGNQIAKRILEYDKDRDDFKDVLVNTEAGGATGAIVSLLASAVGAKLDKLKTKQPEKVAKVDDVIPGLTGTDKVTRTEVTPPTPAENYTGPLTPERQELFARIAAAKIQTGVDMSGGLPPEDQLAVRLIETQLRKAAEEQQGQNNVANWQQMEISDLVAQRDVMLKQGFDPAQIDAINQVIAAKGGEQNAESVPRNESQVPQTGIVPEISGTEGGQDLQLPPQAGAETSQPIQRLEEQPPPAAVEPAPVVESRLANLQAAEDLAKQARESAIAALAEEVLPGAPAPPEPVIARAVAIPEAEPVVSSEPAPVVPPLVDQIGFDNSVFRARPTETTAIGKKGGEAVIVQPAYHERMESDEYTPELAAQLVQNASPEGGVAKQNTHRATAFENADTAEVVVVGTYQLPGGKVMVVDPTSNSGKGINLETFMSQKNQDGDQLWTPLASMWFSETKKGLVERFEDARVFDNEVAKPAKERLAANARSVVAMEGAMQAQSITGEGEIVELASEASYTPKEMSDEFRDVIVEWLPRDKAGGIKSNLDIRDIQEMLLSAFEDPENQDVQRYALGEAVDELKSDERFWKLTPGEQNRALLRYIVERVYDQYQKGGFAEEKKFIQQGGQTASVGQNVRSDLLPEAGNAKLSAVEVTPSTGTTEGGRDTTGTESVRYTGPTVISEPGRASGPQVADQLQYVFDGMRVQGLNLRVGADRLGQIVAEYGIYDNAQNLVVLSMADVQNPSRGNLVTALHEALHAVFAGETPEMQARLHKAIDGLKLEGFTPKLATGATAAVTVEEQLVEATARRFVEAGFNLNRSQSLAQRVWSLLKEIYIKAALVVQQALFGPAHTRQELAIAYMQTRLASFLRGEDIQAGFLQRLGGGKPSHAVQAGFHSNANGEGWVPEYYNWETDTLEYPEALEDSLGAVDYNHLPHVRYKDVEMVADPTTSSLEPQLVATKIATQNIINDVVGKVVAEWTRLGHNTAGLSFQDAKAILLKVDPDKIILRQNAHMAANNLPPVNPATKVSDLLSDSNQRRANNNGLMQLNKLRTDWSIRRSKAEETIARNAVLLPRSITKLLDLMARYTNASAVAKQAADATAGIVKDFKDDIKDIAGLSRKSGMLRQIIESIDQRLDDPLAKQYEVAIERMFKRFVTDTKGERLVDLLETASKLNIDWKNESAKQIRSTLEMSAEANPKLAAFIGKDFDSRALFAIVTAFAKSNQSITDLLEIKAITTDVEREAVNAALKLAISDSKDAIDKARKAIVGKVPKLAVQAERLLSKLELQKKINRRLIDESQRAKEFVDFHEDSIPVMSTEMAKLENAIGAMPEMWEAIEGAEIPVAPNAASKWKDVYDNRKKISFTAKGTTSPQVRVWVDQNEKWLKAQPPDERGANWANLERATKKLAMVDTKLEQDINSGNTWIRLAGSPIHNLEMVGLPATKLAAQRWRRKDALLVNTTKAGQLGVEVDAQLHRTIVAFGWKGTIEEWLRRFYHDAVGYFEHRRDILARNVRPEQAIVEAKSALYSYLSLDPEARAMISKPGAWESYTKYLDMETRNADWISKLKGSQEFGGKVWDKVAGLFRNSIGHPWFDRQRNVRQGMGAVYQHMREAWGGTATQLITKEYAAEAYRNNPKPFLQQMLAQRFTEEVWKEFVQPLVEESGNTRFYGPERGGVAPIAMFTKEAFDLSPIGDIVTFAENLYRLEGGTSDIADFVGETLSTFQEFYSKLGTVYNEENQQGINLAPVPARVIGDARVSEAFPAKWMEYKRYGSQEMRHMVNLMAFEAAYGRNMEGMENNFATAEAQLYQLHSEYENIKAKVAARTIGKSNRVVREELKKEAGGRGNLLRLEQAQRNLLTVEAQHRQFHLLIKAQSGIIPELRSWYEIVGAMAGLVVQRMGTALIDAVTSVEAPFRTLGVSPTAFKNIGSKFKFVASELVNSLFQMIGQEFHMQAEQSRRLTETALATTDESARIKDKISSAWHTPINTSINQVHLQAIEAGLTRFARTARVLISTGIGRSKPGSLVNSPTVKPWAFYTWWNEAIHRGEVVGFWKNVEELILRGRDWYASHPAERADIAKHRFNPKDLNYNKYFFNLINNERAFDFLNKKLGDFGMNLEALARRALDNPGAPILTKEEYQQLAAVIRQEMTIESAETNLNAAFFTNPVLMLGRHLVGWGIGKTTSTVLSFRGKHGAFTGSDGERNWSALKAGLIVTFLGSIPVGLAFAALRDLWDEEVVGKKANVAQFGQGNDFAAMLDKLSRVGTFGVASEPINAVFNQDTTRPFSVDSRVFFLSNIFNMVNTTGTWLRQGEATYATVGRPLATALGGGGFLEGIDILNNLFSLDNAESRVVARINVNNYLRAVGRELNLDVRRSSGGPTLSTPIRPHVSNMLLAALANDYSGFKDAYDKAVEASREEGFPDPVDHVKRSFASYHPLRTVFKTPPSELEYQGILSALNPRGQQDVAQAVDLFNRYAEILGIKEFDGRKEPAPKRSTVTSSQARSNAALGLRSEGVFAR